MTSEDRIKFLELEVELLKQKIKWLESEPKTYQPVYIPYIPYTPIYPYPVTQYWTTNTSKPITNDLSNPVIIPSNLTLTQVGC